MDNSGEGKTLNAEELAEFLNIKMRMSHIYQPLLIRTLLTNHDKVSIREIAQEFLAHDESQIDYYEHIAKAMPISVLRRHGVVQRAGNEVILNAALTSEERAEIIELCDKKVQDYKAQRGSAIWRHRAVGIGTVSGSVRYEVLKQAKFRCALCGIPASERFLEVDHIKPRKHGGADNIENLQALCWKCNSGKAASDDTDFRGFSREVENQGVLASSQAKG